MQLKQLELVGGGALTVYLRDSCDRMPSAIDRPMVLVVPGGGDAHVSSREGDPVALQFAAAGYHTAVLDYAICEQAKNYLPLLFLPRLFPHRELLALQFLYRYQDLSLPVQI